MNSRVVVFALAVVLLHSAEAGAQACSPGSFSATGTEPCTLCPPGTYEPSTGSTACDQCPAGSSNPDSGSTSFSACGDCPSGTFSAQGAGSCSPCPQGTYNPSTNQSMCTPCAPGTYNANTGSSTYMDCLNCGPGTYSPGGVGSCSSCDPGTASAATAASSCPDCAAGTFQSSVGQTACDGCGPGTYELSTGSTICDECPGGQATPCNDNGVCSDGPSGNGTCSCFVGYTGFACENGPTTSTTTSTTTTSTTLPGTCPSAPDTDCVTPLKASLQIRKSEDPAKSYLKWKLSGGSPAVAHPDLGDPSATSSYTLCVYDRSSAVPTLESTMTVAPDALWIDKDPKGWIYKDKDGSQEGIQQVSVKPGDAGKAKAQLKAGGSGLTLPAAFGSGVFFEQDGSVTVELIKQGGPGSELCWRSDFTPAQTSTNTETAFKAAVK